MQRIAQRDIKVVVNFRLSPVELAQLRQAARAQHSTVSDVIRAGLATVGAVNGAINTQHDGATLPA